MASSKAGIHQKDGRLLVYDQLAVADGVQIGNSEDNLGGEEIDAYTLGLPAIGDLTDIGTAEDESADYLAIYDASAGVWKKVLAREFAQMPNYESLSDTTIAPADIFPVWDQSAGYKKSITLANLESYLKRPVSSLKTADQSTSSTSLTSITGLTPTLAASTRYAFEMLLLISASGGYRFDLNGGSATFNQMRMVWEEIDTTGDTTLNTRNNDYTNPATVVISSQNFPVGLVRATGYIYSNAGGSLVPRFARSAVFNSATIREGSWIRLIEL